MHVQEYLKKEHYLQKHEDLVHLWIPIIRHFQIIQYIIIYVPWRFEMSKMTERVLTLCRLFCFFAYCCTVLQWTKPTILSIYTLGKFSTITFTLQHCSQTKKIDIAFEVYKVKKHRKRPELRLKRQGSNISQTVKTVFA